MYASTPIISARFSRSAWLQRRLVTGVALALGTLLPPGPFRGLLAAEAPPATGKAVREDQAIQRYRDALAKNPTAENHAALAWVLSRYESANAEALQHAKAALKLDPRHYKAHEIAAIVSEMQGRDGELLDHLLSMIDQDRPETYVYLRRIGQLDLTVPQRRKAIGALDRFIAQPGRPIDRTAAGRTLALLLLKDGQIDRAQAMYDAPLFIKAWRVIGPFDNEANAGLNLAHGPEKEIDLTKSYEGRGQQVSWRSLDHLTPAGLCDFEAVMYPNDQVLAYALTYVKAPQRTEAVVRMGAEQSVKLWVNDQRVIEDDQDKGFALDQYVAPVVLEPGWNKILVKVCRHNSGWMFALRLTDAQGGPLEGLSVSTDPQPTPDRSKAAAPTFAYQGGALGHFGRQVAEDRRNESAVYYLGLAQALAYRRAPAAETFEWLVSLNRHCSEYRLRLALAYWADEKPDKAFEQLKEALSLEPKNPLALTLLGRFYRSRDSLEKARETLDAAVSAAPDVPAGHLALQEVYAARGWAYRAYEKAKMLHERHSDSSSLTANYATLCNGYGYRERARQLWSQAVDQDAMNLGARRALIRLDTEEDHVDAALKACMALQRLEPLSHAVRMERVNLLLRREQYDQAAAVCEEGLAICPTHAGFWTKLGGIRERQGRMPDAMSAWRTALRYKPDDQRLRDYVEFLQPEQENPVFAKFGVAAEEVKRLIETTKADEATYPKADAVILLQHHVTQIFEDGSSTSQEQGICKVLNERGRRKYTKVPLQGKNRKILRAVVIKPDGTEVEATEVSDAAIHFAQLQPGSTLEYKVVYHRGETSWLSRHFTHWAQFQSADPVVRRQLILVYPKGQTVRYVARGEHIKQTRSEFQGQTVHEFRADNMPMLEPEPARPPAADIIEQVRVSTIEDWDEIARWEWALIKDQIESDTAIRKKVRELTADAKTRRDKIRAVYNFVAQEIQYKVLHPSAIFGIKPQKAANVLANEWGECKGKAVLLIAMLGELGIDACYATLRTRSAGKLVRDLPANQCDHAIVYVPDPKDPGGGLWLDGTAEYNGMDELPWADRGVPALVWDKHGRMTFKDIPQVGPDQNVITMVLDATMSKEGSASVRSSWHATGQFAAGFRQQFRRVGRRREQLEAVVTSLQSGGQLTDMTFSDLTDRDLPADIRFDFKAARYAEQSGSRLILQPKRRFELTKRYTPRTERHYDVWLPMPSTVAYSEVYRFDPAWTVVSVPESLRLETPWIDYEAGYTTAPGEVRADKRVVIKAADIARSEYEKLQKLCIAADQHEQKTIVLEPK